MRTNAGYLKIFLLTCVLLPAIDSCSKKDQTPALTAAEITEFILSPGGHTEISANPVHSIKIQLPDTISSGRDLIANFRLSPGATVTVNGFPQQNGITRNNYEDDLNFKVTAADHRTSIDWLVRTSNNNYSISWGLGHFINKTKNNNRDYNWYIDQSTSGNFASVNCGPASVTMAIKWADPAFTKTALDARMTYEVSGGWWFTNDIDAYLNDNNISHAIIGLSINKDSSGQILSHQLDHQQVIILCLDMNYVRSVSDQERRVDKFYPTTPGWGHFIVLKGYKIVDGDLFFEAYDPYSFGQTNTDQTLKGMNRYYRNEDLAAACGPWWNFAFVIAKKGENLSLDAAKRKLNPLHVPVAHSANPNF